MARAVDQAYRMLRDGIFRGTYPVGVRLREEEIAGGLKVSRSPVREALRRLSTEGLVDLIPNRGAVVSTWDSGELHSILDIRSMLEGYGIRHATSRISDTDLDRLEGLCQQAERLVSSRTRDRMRQAADVNQEFHALILSNAGSSRLVNALSGLSHVPLLMGVSSDAYEEAMQRSLQHHREIVAAMRSRDDSWAESIMTAHIRAARGAHRDTPLTINHRRD